MKQTSNPVPPKFLFVFKAALCSFLAHAFLRNIKLNRVKCNLIKIILPVFIYTLEIFTAQALYSGIFAFGSRAGFVSLFAGESAK